MHCVENKENEDVKDAFFMSEIFSFENRNKSSLVSFNGNKSRQLVILSRITRVFIDVGSRQSSIGHFLIGSHILCNSSCR